MPELSPLLQPLGGEPEGPPELMRVLDPSECYELLASHSVGRVVHTRNALPAVTPVNYAIQGHQVIIRTTAGSAVADTAKSESVVAFEVDDIDRDSEIGWSVVAVGVARLVTDEGELLRAAQHPIRPFAGGRRDTIVSITPGTITGRRVGPPRLDGTSS